MKKNKKEKTIKKIEELHREIAELERLERDCRISEGECKRLESERATLLKIIETTQDALFVISNDGTIVYTNPAMDELFGYKKGELIGKTPAFFNIDPKPIKFMKDKIKIINKTGHWEGQVRNRKKNGTTFVSHVVATALKDNKGKVINILITEHDVTEHNHIKTLLDESSIKLQHILTETINAIAMTIEKRDMFTAGHQRRVAELASAIAREMNLPKDKIMGVYMSGLLHDIGKINIPAELLMKPSKLTELEFKLIKNHPQITYDILKDIEFPWPIAQISLQHHERMDGSGYPNGLKNEDIILESRILAVADVVEAMSSARPYRPALGIEEALKEISGKKALLYDADVVDTCVKLFKKKGFKFK
ncbi:MAG: HD domain-containing protein [Candidatus Ratteibacteria bacterium]|nr:HD domain-containing protein [Candidatus Ratteibacteria bacterium]